MDVLIESMTKVAFKGYTIRCWREESAYNNLVKERTLDDILKELATVMGNVSMETLGEHILAMDRMNAVEVLDSEGLGPVLYKDWP